MKQIAYIGLGSNIGEGRATLLNAWREIGRHAMVDLKELSAPYLSAPVGMDSNNWFTNAAGALHTELSPEGLLHLLMQVEKNFGRNRDASHQGYQDRTLDLDILYYADVVRHDELLTLPHPCLGERLFVLKPLCEIAPDFHDPLDGRTPAEKLALLESRMSRSELPRQEISRARWS